MKLSMSILGLVSLGAAAASLAAETRLQEHDITAAVSSNTATFFSADLGTIEAYFAPGGRLRGTYERERFSGHWSVDADRLCLDLPGDADDGCFTVVTRGGDELQLFTEAGEPAGDFRISEGNPEGF